MRDLSRRLAENLSRVRGRMAEAALRSGRTADAVTLVAVTKYVDAETARALVAAGCRDLGESRPQELWHKAEALAEAAVRWHLVGHLQRNKVARTLPLAVLLHSGDSVRLLESIDVEASRLGRTVPLLLEVNVSGDAAKHGFRPDEVERLAEQLVRLTHVEVRGLMAMAGREGDLAAARRDFAALRCLRDRLQTVWPERLRLAELSMGMSGDFEAAIEEGATIVRVGSALFEGLA